MWFKWDGNDLIIKLKIQTRASRDELLEAHNDCLKVRIKAAPVDGKANLHLIKFLAKTFKVPTTSITIVRGKTSRQKSLRVSNPQKIPAIFQDQHPLDNASKLD